MVSGKVAVPGNIRSTGKSIDFDEVDDICLGKNLPLCDLGDVLHSLWRGEWAHGPRSQKDAKFPWCGGIGPDQYINIIYAIPEFRRIPFLSSIRFYI